MGFTAELNASSGLAASKGTSLITEPPGRLQERFDPRRNHLGAIRLGLATTVAFTHAQAVGFGHQPHLGRTRIGELAVDAFFVLSGFLLAGSYLRLDSVPRYLWHRFLRIMPGFWVCLLITALVVAPLIAWLQNRSTTSVFTGEQSSFDYLVQNCALGIRQFGITGLPQGVPQPDNLNGSLWTLGFEALCYAAVIGLGLIGALKRRPEMTLAIVTVLWIATVTHALGFELVPQQRLLRFVLMFLLGSVIYLYADKIPIGNRYAVVALVLLLAALVVLPEYRSLGGPALAYLCLWLAVVRPPQGIWRSDLSYGLYVYHWPVLQLLVVAEVRDVGEPTFIVVGVLLAAAAAALSWFLVERPALRHKDAAWVSRIPMLRSS
jgi:peptidoglycan/LPS O-acetylase OafA/YrhL